VIVTNTAGATTSSVAALTVLIPAAIITHPASQVLWVGSNATFSVAATGSELVYQWRFNGTNLSDATADLLTRTNVQLPNSGFYVVLVTNFVSAVTSTSARLTVVDEPPRFQSIAALASNQYKLVLTGVVGNYHLETSTNLNSAWMHLATLTNATGFLDFTHAPNDSAMERNYRAVIVP